MRCGRILRLISSTLILSVFLGGFYTQDIHAALPEKYVTPEEEVLTDDEGEYSIEALGEAIAQNTPGKSKITLRHTSKEFFSGYYIIYEVNGHQYRSDRMGYRCNQMVWNELSDTQKKDLLVDFIAAPSQLKAQFGEENTKEMLEWYEGYSGLTEARKILKDRIAKREYPKLQYFYSESYGVRAKVELPGDPTELNSYKFLPEVREFLSIDEKMRACYDTGYSSYKILVDAKTGQISTAIKGLSAVMIKQLICDRVLVPAITPGGLGALVPEIKSELWGIYDNFGEVTKKIYNKCGLGEWPDGDSAREIIDNYWLVINSNERYTEICVDKFMDLKAEKSTVYDKAVAAVKKYKEDSEKEEQRILNEILEAGKNPGSTQPKTNTARLAGESDEEWKNRVRSALSNELAEFWTSYNKWEGDVKEDASQMRNQLGDIMAGYSEYSNPAYSYSTVNSVNGFDYDSLLNADDYYDAVVNVPAAFSDAQGKTDARISKLAEYSEEYAGKVAGYKETWDSYNSRLNGLRSTIRLFDGVCDDSLYTHYVINGEASDSTAITSYQETCGAYYVSGYSGDVIPVSLEEADKLLKEQKKVFSERLKVWNDKVEQYEKKLNLVISEYEEMQTLDEDAEAEYDTGFEEAKSIAAGSNEKYFYPDDIDNTVFRLKDSSLQSLYDFSLSARNAEVLSALCDSWGADLSDKMDRWQISTAKKNIARNDIIRAKHGADSALRIMTGSSDNFDKIIDHLNKFGGKNLKKYDEIAPGYGTGDMMAYAKSDDPNLVAPLYNSYSEFADSNTMAFEYDMYYASMLEEKPNYMRGKVDEETLMAPYYDGDSPLRREPGINPEYGSYYKQYTYTAPLFLGLMDMEGVKGTVQAGKLFDETVKGSWSWELAHGYVPVSGLEYEDTDLSETGLAMNRGEIKDLNGLVKVLPLNASDKMLFWESDDPDVISFDEEGIAIANEEGTAAVTVRARDSAWVKNEDGSITYTPAPLTFTITVGEGVKAGTYWNHNSTWKNYGTEEEPRLYLYSEPDENTGLVTCSVSSVTVSEAHILVALYDDDDRMLASSILPYTYEPGYRTVSLTADTSNGLLLKAFAISADDTLSALDGEYLINEKIR